MDKKNQILSIVRNYLGEKENEKAYSLLLQCPSDDEEYKVLFASAKDAYSKELIASIKQAINDNNPDGAKKYISEYKNAIGTNDDVIEMLELAIDNDKNHIQVNDSRGQVQQIPFLSSIINKMKPLWNIDIRKYTLIYVGTLLAILGLIVLITLYGVEYYYGVYSLSVLATNAYLFIVVCKSTKYRKDIVLVCIFAVLLVRLLLFFLLPSEEALNTLFHDGHKYTGLSSFTSFGLAATLFIVAMNSKKEFKKIITIYFVAYLADFVAGVFNKSDFFRAFCIIVFFIAWITAIIRTLRNIDEDFASSNRTLITPKIKIAIIAIVAIFAYMVYKAYPGPLGVECGKAYGGFSLCESKASVLKKLEQNGVKFDIVDDFIYIENSNFCIEFENDKIVRISDDSSYSRPNIDINNSRLRSNISGEYKDFISGYYYTGYTYGWSVSVGE